MKTSPQMFGSRKQRSVGLVVLPSYDNNRNATPVSEDSVILRDLGGMLCTANSTTVSAHRRGRAIDLSSAEASSASYPDAWHTHALCLFRCFLPAAAYSYAHPLRCLPLPVGLCDPQRP